MSKKLLNLLLVVIMLAVLVPTVLAAPPVQEGGQDYVVVADDWLSKLADKYLGNPFAYPAITYYTNQKNKEDGSYAKIVDPDLIEVGWKIYIPNAVEAEAYLSTVSEAKERFPGLVTPGVLTVADSGKAPPGTMTDENGQPMGAWIDLTSKFAEDLGLELNVVYLDWPGVLPGLKAGKFDVAGSGVGLTEERLASPDFLWSDPYSATGVALVVKKDSGIETWDDMAGKKLAVLRGEREADVALERVGDIVSEVLEYPGKQEGFLEVQTGRVDGFAASSHSLQYMVKSAPGGDQLKVVGPILDMRGQGTAIRKDLPELRDAINELIAQYLEDGTLEEIYGEWYGRPSPFDALKEMRQTQ